MKEATKMFISTGACVATESPPCLWPVLDKFLDVACQQFREGSAMLEKLLVTQTS